MEGLKRARPAEFADLPQGVLAHLVHFLPPVQQLYTFPQVRGARHGWHCVGLDPVGRSTACDNALSLTCSAGA